MKNIMIALDFILKNKEVFEISMRKRGLSFSFEKFEAFEKDRKFFISETQKLQEKRNFLSKSIAQAKASGKEDAHLFLESESVKKMLPEIEKKLYEKEEEIRGFLLEIPNILIDDVPEGEDEKDNREEKKQGNPPSFNFTPREHFEIGESIKEDEESLMDFPAAARISGSRFVVLRGKLSSLERALINFCVEENVKRGYKETSVPFIVKPQAFVGTGQLPKFEGDFFKMTQGSFLIPTAEVSLTNLVRETVLPERKLPLKLTSVTPCFRSEAGSAGRDTRGMMRQHQFLKVELVTVANPSCSEKEHIFMVETAENILVKLGLPFRRMLLCSKDTGFSAMKTYDLEVWLPGQGRYREISSISNTGSFQAFRMDAKFKDAKTKKNEYVHTLNGSSLAIGRLIIAIMENFQLKEGGFMIPSPLIKYTGFDTIL